MSAHAMRLGIIEPHLECFGGIRRMVEFANRLTARGHDVTFFLPDDARLQCDWMPCDARIAPITSGFETPLDIVLFNSEPQWHLIERFTKARRRVFYALHYASLYNKEGSWESIRAPVDLQLANSNWTADQIFQETGYRPVVQLGGVNRDTFRPYGLTRNIPLLTNGERHRSWKGTDTVIEAGRLAGARVAMYSGKGLDQHELGRRYARAQVFAVGSWFEGFCQPGLESLACGTPLVTTDNGGCREYAIDGETALVVAPRDARAMGDAIRRLRSDRSFAETLSANGLELVARDFDWEQRTDEFAAVLDGVIAGQATAPPRVSTRVEAPELSIVVRGGDDLRQTQLFVERARRHTDVPFEVVIADAGTGWEAENYARYGAEAVAKIDPHEGFGLSMNAAAAQARGTYVAFCTVDTVLPAGWASRLLETARSYEHAAIVVPAAGAGDGAEVLPTFSDAPRATVYLVSTELVAQIGDCYDDYETPRFANFDLCFEAWSQGLDVVCDHELAIPYAAGTIQIRGTRATAPASTIDG